MMSDRGRSHGDWPGDPHSRPDGAVATQVALLEDDTAENAELLSRPEWLLAMRIAASKGLNKSEFLPRFLLFVCEQYLLGNAQEVTEQRIGIQVFNRSDDYNPGEDNIVRSYARLLRKRLDRYFDGEGQNEPMRITIPRGGYLPVFLSNGRAAVSFVDRKAAREGSQPTESVMAVQDVAQPVAAASRGAQRPVWLAALCGFLAGICLAALVWLASQPGARVDDGPAHALWIQIFQPNQNTLIVPSDSGLGIIQNLSGHLVSLQEYANGTYLSDMKPPPKLDLGNFNDLRGQRYTSLVSLDIVSTLSRLPEFIANRSQIRYARAITAEDLKNTNVVLIGSKHTNPWVTLFEKRLNFRLEYTPEIDESYVHNEQPMGGEQTVYKNGGADQDSSHTYGTIAFLPGLDGVGHVLIIQGLNMAATQAAADTLFNTKLMKPVLQQATLANGCLKPFELLVETTSLGATAPGAQIIASRIYTP